MRYPYTPHGSLGEGPWALRPQVVFAFVVTVKFRPDKLGATQFLAFFREVIAYSAGQIVAPPLTKNFPT